MSTPAASPFPPFAALGAREALSAPAQSADAAPADPFEQFLSAQTLRADDGAQAAEEAQEADAHAEPVYLPFSFFVQPPVTASGTVAENTDETSASADAAVPVPVEPTLDGPVAADPSAGLTTGTDAGDSTAATNGHAAPTPTAWISRPQPPADATPAPDGAAAEEAAPVELRNAAPEPVHARLPDGADAPEAALPASPTPGTAPSTASAAASNTLPTAPHFTAPQVVPSDGASLRDIVAQTLQRAPAADRLTAAAVTDARYRIREMLAPSEAAADALDPSSIALPEAAASGPADTASPPPPSTTAELPESLATPAAGRTPADSVDEVAPRVLADSDAPPAPARTAAAADRVEADAPADAQAGGATAPAPSRTTADEERVRHAALQLDTDGPAPSPSSAQPSDAVAESVAAPDRPAAPASSTSSAPEVRTAAPEPLPARIDPVHWARLLDRVGGARRILEITLDDGDGTLRVQADRGIDGLTVQVRFSDPELHALAGAHASRLQDALSTQLSAPVRLSLADAPSADAGGSGQHPSGQPEREGSAQPTNRVPAAGASVEPTERRNALGHREWVG
jgi:hypothetical protein